MKKSINRFQSFEDLDKYHEVIMKNSTIEERFRWLKSIQEFTLLMHPPKDSTKKITIRKWIC